MKTMSLWFGVLASIGVGCALQGISISSFFHTTSALIVFGPVACCLFFMCGPQGTLNLARRVFNASVNENDKNVIRQICTVANLCGAVAFLSGTIHVLQHLADTASIGEGVAVAIVGLFYGLVPTLLLSPIAREHATPASTGNSRAMMYVAASFAGASMMVTTVLYALSRFV